MAEGSNKSLVHVELDGKAAEALIKETARGVEGLLRPRQIKKIAKAEADAALIKTKAEIKVAELRQRAAYRLQEEAILHQQNLEAIAERTQLQLMDGADSERVDNDWMSNFRDKARLISNEEMQGLWSRVLAGEINRPGTFSRRTVNAIANLDRFDCEAFTKLCCFCVCIGEHIPLVFNENEAVYRDNGVTFGTLLHLESIGLILFPAGNRTFAKTAVKAVEIVYFGERFLLEMPEGTDGTLSIGKVALTLIGRELAPIAGAEPLPVFRDFVLHHWERLVKPLAGPDTERVARAT